MNTSNTQKIFWPQIAVLIGLNVFLVLSWLIYDNFQPVLLQNFNLNSHKPVLDLIHLVIMVFVPMLSAYVGEKYFAKNQKKLLVITVAVVVTALIFMATGTVVKLQNTLKADYLKFVFTFLFTCWMIAMNVFNSPANSFLEKFSSTDKWPLVAGLFTFTSDLVLSCETQIDSIVNFLGIHHTLLVAGVLLSVLGIVFYKVFQDQKLSDELDTSRLLSAATPQYFKIIVLGLVLGIISGVIKFIVPLYPASELNPVHILAVAAIFALPFGFYIKEKYFQQAIVVSIILFGMGMLNINHNNFYLNHLFLGISLSMISVVGLPWILQLSGSKHIIGIGVFLGFSELAEGLLELFSVYC